MSSPRSEEQILKAEQKWLDSLRGICRRIFSGVFLPSHDDSHHLRVWQHAKIILRTLDREGVWFEELLTVEQPDGELLAEELILAVFFHDTGLSVTPGERHGLESRRFFDDYLKAEAGRFRSIPPESIQRIRFAIEKHDDKSYHALNSGAHAVPGLDEILSAADDLDAFGNIGIYRYAEIYMHRGMKPEELPAPVSDNARNRFLNLTENSGLSEDFIRMQEPGFLRVYEFYLQLAADFASAGERSSWEIALIGIIHDAILKKKNLLYPGREIPDTGFSQVREWFNNLDSEIRSMGQV